MKVQIFSMMAALCGGEHGAQWEGDVPDVMLGLSPIQGRIENGKRVHDPAEVNEQIYRLFNRIDEPDDERLGRWGYHLPSLSVGDFVTWGGKTYAVNTMGFQTVTGQENEAARYVSKHHLDTTT